MNEDVIAAMEMHICDLMKEMVCSDANCPERKAMAEEIKILSERVTEARKVEMDAWDKEQRRRIEEEKNQTMAEIEKNKQKIGWERWAFELLKMGITIGTGMYSFFKAQKNVIKFEETGRFTSTAGRELHLPKLTWWK